MQKRNFLLCPLLGIALLGATGAALAVPITAAITPCKDLKPFNLGELIDDELTIRCDDKEFSNFDYMNTASDPAYAVPASAITVMPFGALGHPGVRFVFSAMAPSGKTNDLAFFFDVAVNPGGQEIIGSELGVVGFFRGDGLVSAGEALSDVDPTGPVLPPLQAYLSNDIKTATDSALFRAVRRFTVNKDLQLWGGADPHGMAQASILINQFTEIEYIPPPDVVPEIDAAAGAGAIMALAGVMGLLADGRRRSRRRAGL